MPSGVLILRSGLLGRVSKDAAPGLSWFETREAALLTMRNNERSTTQNIRPAFYLLRFRAVGRMLVCNTEKMPRERNKGTRNHVCHAIDVRQGPNCNHRNL
jgi:hypothetical protein